MMVIIYSSRLILFFSFVVPARLQRLGSETYRATPIATARQAYVTPNEARHAYGGPGAEPVRHGYCSATTKEKTKL